MDSADIVAKQKVAGGSLPPVLGWGQQSPPDLKGSVLGSSAVLLLWIIRYLRGSGEDPFKVRL